MLYINSIQISNKNNKQLAQNKNRKLKKKKAANEIEKLGFEKTFLCREETAWKLNVERVSEWDFIDWET